MKLCFSCVFGHVHRLGHLGHSVLFGFKFGPSVFGKNPGYAVAARWGNLNFPLFLQVTCLNYLFHFDISKMFVVSDGRPGLLYRFCAAQSLSTYCHQHAPNSNRSYSVAEWGRAFGGPGNTKV
jgi:hypothetical protein